MGTKRKLSKECKKLLAIAVEFECSKPGRGTMAVRKVLAKQAELEKRLNGSERVRQVIEKNQMHVADGQAALSTTQHLAATPVEALCAAQTEQQTLTCFSFELDVLSYNEIDYVKTLRLEPNHNRI